MQIGADLRDELDRWLATGQTARFWLRDDDAVTDTPQLRRLLELTAAKGLSPAIAVIPEKADHLLRALLTSVDCCIWQHGWGHYTHAAGEFGEGRPLDLMLLDAEAGQRAMDALFGPHRWQRVFVPPFHLLSLNFKAAIPRLGFLGVSAGVQLTPRISGVYEANAEIDVMDWPAHRMFTDEAICGMIVEQLAARRVKQAPTARPVGLLTHHLVFGAHEWDRIAALLDYLRAHPAVEWARADSLFGGQAPMPLASEDTPAVTVVVTSCGRPDLLERTLDSFLEFNTYPIREFIIMEDGPPGANPALELKYREHPFRWLATGGRVGQIAAIDLAYGHVKTELIFHCEDDWEFTAPGFIEKSLAVLTANLDVLQVWIRALSDTNGHPVMEHLFFAGAVPYRLLQPRYHTEEWGVWHGFSFNPGLRRRRDYIRIGSFSSFSDGGLRRAYEVERAASEAYLQEGLLAAVLADNLGRGYVRHLGWGRRVEASHQ